MQCVTNDQQEIWKWDTTIAVWKWKRIKDQNCTFVIRVLETGLSKKWQLFGILTACCSALSAILKVFLSLNISSCISSLSARRVAWTCCVLPAFNMRTFSFRFLFSSSSASCFSCQPQIFLGRRHDWASGYFFGPLTPSCLWKNGEKSRFTNTTGNNSLYVECIYTLKRVVRERICKRIPHLSNGQACVGFLHFFRV